MTDTKQNKVVTHTFVRSGFIFRGIWLMFCFPQQRRFMAAILTVGHYEVAIM